MSSFKHRYLLDFGEVVIELDAHYILAAFTELNDVSYKMELAANGSGTIEFYKLVRSVWVHVQSPPTGLYLTKWSCHK